MQHIRQLAQQFIIKNIICFRNVSNLHLEEILF